MPSLYVEDSDTGDKIPLKLVDNGDGTFSISIAGITIDGGVTVDDVTVSNFPESQAVTVAALPLPSGAATQTTLASIDTKTPSLSSGRVPVDGSGVTQPVNGTVTANIGTIGDAASELTSFGIKYTLENITATEATLSTLNNKLPALSDGRVVVDGSGVTQPISGTVTANLGTLNGVATQTTLASVLSDLDAKANLTEAEPGVTRGKMRVVRLTPTVSATAYTANDCVGGKLTLPDVIPATGRGTFLHSIRVTTTFTTNVSGLRLVILDADPSSSTLTNDAAVQLVAQDHGKVCAVIDLDTPKSLDSSSNSYSTTNASSTPLPISIMPNGSTSIYAYIIDTLGVTPGATTPQIELVFTFYDA